MKDFIYSNNQIIDRVTSLDSIIFMNYLIDAEVFFIINIDPELDDFYGNGTVSYIEQMCHIYISDIYY